MNRPLGFRLPPPSLTLQSSNRSRCVGGRRAQGAVSTFWATEKRAGAALHGATPESEACSSHPAAH